MTTKDTGASRTAPATEAVGSLVERGVRALDPERAAFEAWLNPGRHAGNVSLWVEPGRYEKDTHNLAWLAWQAARPKRAAVGRLINLAAELAQHRPIRGLEALAERSGRTLGRRALEFTLEATEESLSKMAHDIAGAVRAL